MIRISANGGGQTIGASAEWLSPTNATVGGFGALAGVAGYTAGKLTVGTNLTTYSSGWGGNQHVATAKVADLGKAAGAATLVFGTALDAIGVRNYYVLGPTSPNSVHPGKAGLNLGVGIWSVATGPVGVLGGGTYWLVDTFYPGGLLGAAVYQGSLLERNQSVLGPSFSLHRDWP